MMLRGGLVLGLLWAIFVHPASSVSGSEPCGKGLKRIVDLEGLRTFQLRSWFASEDPKEQQSVFTFLVRQGMHQKGPLHPLEIRRWKEFRRDLLNSFKKRPDRLSHEAKSELEGLVSEILLKNILSPSLMVGPLSSLDQKLGLVLDQVSHALESLDQLPTESIDALPSFEAPDLTDDGFWDLIVRLNENEGKSD
jgi:hypothetical protein